MLLYAASAGLYLTVPDAGGVGFERRERGLRPNVIGRTGGELKGPYSCLCLADLHAGRCTEPVTSPPADI